MNCAELTRWIGPLLDGELDVRNTTEIQSHLATCPGCGRRYEAQQALASNLRRLDLGYTAPVSLRNRINAALETEMSAAAVDQILWQRGAGARYKASPRHRSRCTAY